MLKTFVRLLGEDAPTLRRYAVMAVFYGLLSGLTLITLVPLISHLLAGDALEAGRWLIALLFGVTACALWRRTLDKAGVAVGVAVLQGARQRVGDHVARLPLGWFSAQNSARLGHLITQGMMAVAQLPAHVFTLVISGAVTPLVLVAALFALHWPLGVLALLALPVLVGVMLLTARLGQSADNTYQQNFAQTSQRMVEFAQAQSVLRAFNGSGGATRLLDQAIDQQRQSGQRLIYRSSLSAVFNAWAVQGIFCALLVAVALWCDALMPTKPSPPAWPWCWCVVISNRCWKWPVMARSCAAPTPSSMRCTAFLPSSRCRSPRKRKCPWIVRWNCATSVFVMPPTNPRCCAG